MKRDPRPPYAEGDRFGLLHMCGDETHLANVTVISCKPAPSSTPHAPTWTVVVTACDNHSITVTVDARGRHGYITRALGRAS